MPVLNKYHYNGKVPVDAVNIMRGTVFGNPFVIGIDGDRPEVLKQYRQWLWTKIQTDDNYAARVKQLYGRDLCCCCSPAPCHGDVLLAAAAWLSKQPPTI